MFLPVEGEGTLRLRVSDPEGGPVQDARVLVDGRPVGSVADGGRLDVEGLVEGPHTVEVQHPDYTASVTDGVRADGTPVGITLRRERGSVRVSVLGPDGQPVTDAVARFLGPRRLPPVALGFRGSRVQVLGSGTWTPAGVVAVLRCPRSERSTSLKMTGP